MQECQKVLETSVQKVTADAELGTKFYLFHKHKQKGQQKTKK